MTTENKFWDRLTLAQKKKLRPMLDDLQANRKAQIALFEKNLIEPLRKQIYLVDDVKKSMVPINRLVKENERLSKWITAFLGNAGKIATGEQDAK